MSLVEWLRRRFSSPAELAEADKALHDEYGTPSGEEDAVEQADQPGATAPGGLGPSLPGTPAAAEAAEAEIEAEEAPRDPGG
ncbi:MAG TPA: hypothetical protein VE088_06095 [Gaiellaceae bacterium]|nr:hypothetical protein [Gaiellaceae bacterium]